MRKHICQEVIRKMTRSQKDKSAARKRSCHFTQSGGEGLSDMLTTEQSPQKYKRTIYTGEEYSRPRQQQVQRP